MGKSEKPHPTGGLVLNGRVPLVGWDFAVLMTGRETSRSRFFKCRARSSIATARGLPLASDERKPAGCILVYP